MKRTTIKMLYACVFMLMGVGTQAQNYDTHELIMRFVEGTPQSVQDDIMETYNLVLIEGPTPITDFRLCRIDPYFPNLPGDFYENAVDSINGVVQGINNLSGDVDAIGLQYRIEYPYSIAASMGDVGVPHPLEFCGDGNFSADISVDGTSNIKVGAYDTGIAGYQEGASYQLYFPYLFDAHFPGPTVGYDFNNSTNFFPEDLNGHGTHMLSTIVSETSMVSDLLELRAFKTHGDNGTGKLFDVLQGIDQGIIEDIKIVNMSFSYGAPSEHRFNTSSPLYVAIEEALDQSGTLFIAAAGNNGENNDNSLDAAFPASFPNPNIISVAAIDCSGELAEFSGYGESTIDLAAPGENIIGAFQHGEVTQLTGTSPATAMVSRVATMLAAHQSYFDYIPIKCAILNGATNNPSLFNKTVSGGYLDGEDAYQYFITSCGGVTGKGGTGGDGVSNGRSLDKYNKDSNYAFDYEVNNLGVVLIVNSDKDQLTEVEIFNTIGQRVDYYNFYAKEGISEFSVPLALDDNLDIYFMQVRIGSQIEVVKIAR